MVLLFTVPLWLGLIIFAVVAIARNGAEKNRRLRAGQEAVRALEALRKCPDCAELIKREAKVCRYCGCKLQPLDDIKRLPDAALESGEAVAPPEFSGVRRIAGLLILGL